MSERKAEKLSELAKASQERTAARLYEPEAVMAEITRLAGLGFHQYRIVQDCNPIPLEKTQAAARLCAMLDRHGLNYDLAEVEVAAGARGNETGDKVKHKELLIMW